jgi:hypothetical protein
MRQYALDILERAGMTNCKPCSTPVDTQVKLSATLGDLVVDPIVPHCYDRHPVRPARATWLGGRGRPGGPRAR